jgi:hypothetical protein
MTLECGPAASARDVGDAGPRDEPSALMAAELRQAVERQHHCSARLTQSVLVKEIHGGTMVWEGVVHVFDLTGHLRPPVHMRGHLQSRAATSGGSLPCCIRGRSSRRLMRFGQRSCKNLGNARYDLQPIAVRNGRFAYRSRHLSRCLRDREGPPVKAVEKTKFG